MSYISIANKIIYNTIIKNENLNSRIGTTFIDLSFLFLFFESLSAFDALLIFFCTVSVIKYTFFWIPSLTLISSTVDKYFKNIFKVLLFCVLILGSVTTFFFFNNFSQVGGFQNYADALIRSYLLFISGSPYHARKIFLVDEDLEYIFRKLNWIL